MKAKPYTIVAVRMPHELRDVLETIAISKGETLSVVVRDLVRQGAGEARRFDRGVSHDHSLPVDAVLPDLLSGSPISAKDFR